MGSRLVDDLLRSLCVARAYAPCALPCSTRLYPINRHSAIHMLRGPCTPDSGRACNTQSYKIGEIVQLRRLLLVNGEEQPDI